MSSLFFLLPFPNLLPFLKSCGTPRTVCIVRSLRCTSSTCSGLYVNGISLKLELNKCMNKKLLQLFQNSEGSNFRVNLTLK